MSESEILGYYPTAWEGTWLEIAFGVVCLILFLLGIIIFVAKTGARQARIESSLAKKGNPKEPLLGIPWGLSLGNLRQRFAGFSLLLEEKDRDLGLARYRSDWIPFELGRVNFKTMHFILKHNRLEAIRYTTHFEKQLSEDERSRIANELEKALDGIFSYHSADGSSYHTMDGYWENDSTKIQMFAFSSMLIKATEIVICTSCKIEVWDA